MAFFDNKTIFITGGTGSIGSVVLEKVLQSKVNKVIVYSRDEYKQYQLKYKYPNEKRLQFILGDIRDFIHLKNSSKDCDILFHCAALKHVPVSEQMPEEFIKTNILGSINVKNAALDNNIPIVVSVSTDKSVDPSNVMGHTKAIQEKIFTSSALKESTKEQKMVNVRFGNVIGTKGSLFPIIYDQIKNGKPLTITHKDMTRFFMTEDEAADLILWAAQNANKGEIVIKKMKAINIYKLFRYFLKFLKQDKTYKIEDMGIRVGEKIHEKLITEEELGRVYFKNGYYCVAPYSFVNIHTNKNVDLSSKFDIKNFVSDNTDNEMSEIELDKYIQDFIYKIEHKSLI